jgi:hypothetical protein
MRKQLFSLIAGVAFVSLGGLTLDGSEALADPTDSQGVGAFCVFSATAFDVDVCVTFFRLLSNPSLGPVATCKLLQFTSPELFDELWKNFGECVKTRAAQ